MAADPKVIRPVRFDPDDLEAVAAKAKRQGRTSSDVIRRAVKKDLAGDQASAGADD